MGGVTNLVWGYVCVMVVGSLNPGIENKKGKRHEMELGNLQGPDS